MRRKTVDLHYAISQAAVLLGNMSRRWVRDKIKAGELDGFMLGNKLIVSAESVNRLLEKRRIKEAPGD